MYELRKSTRKDKKHMLVDDEDNKIHFGAHGYSDYTIHNDEKRKRNYLARHKTNEDWTIKNGITAGFLSRWILWNRESIDLSLNDIKKKFKISITNML
jgi:hypothetical protein